MREHLYRGKRVDNVEIVEGCYFEYENKHYIGTLECISKKTNNYQIKQESVEQYTGFNDKNGKRIFEGDKIKDDDLGIGLIVFAAGCFMIEWVDEDCYRDLLGFEDFNRCIQRDFSKIEIV